MSTNVSLMFLVKDMDGWFECTLVDFYRKRGIKKIISEYQIRKDDCTMHRYTMQQVFITFSVFGLRERMSVFHLDIYTKSKHSSFLAFYTSFYFIPRFITRLTLPRCS